MAMTKLNQATLTEIQHYDFRCRAVLWPSGNDTWDFDDILGAILRCHEKRFAESPFQFVDL